MKFAKYLESESIPEWRRAYINYKGLKKRLKAIEKASILSYQTKKRVY
jgi:SPX domain protein involved in polyphosphate accumulation